MERIGGQRPHWGRRASVLALIGGLIGGIVVFVGVLTLLQGVVRMQAPSSFDQVVIWVGRDPGLGADLILAALAYGGPCGAVLGLVIWSVWFLVSRRVGAPDCDSSSPP
jgi:hypothetical protein